MKLAVIGTGYIGIVGAAVFADWGNQVTGIDIIPEKIEMIKNGVMPIFEPGLKEIVMSNMELGRLTFTTSLVEGIKDAEIIFICVGTPQGSDGRADLRAVWAVAAEIGKSLTSYKVIVVKSTVPVGTNEKVKKIIAENLQTNVEFDVVSNPEFLREGYSIEDMQNTERTILGFESPDVRAVTEMRKLYGHLPTPLVETDLRSAEMIKYASNSFLATKISFINEIGQLCERAGADVSAVAKGMGLDSRIGSRFLYPGIGYGGSCFPKDVSALFKTSTDFSYDFKILRSVIEVNEAQRDEFLKKFIAQYGYSLEGKTFGVLGLSFKENTDDIRESVSIKFIKYLRGLGAKIKVYDPQAMDNAKKILGNENIEYMSSKEAVLDGSDALVILTEWKEFATLDLDLVGSKLKAKVIFDGRNLLNREQVQQKGFTYYAIGKKTNGLLENIEIIERKTYGPKESKF